MPLTSLERANSGNPDGTKRINEYHVSKKILEFDITSMPSLSSVAIHLPTVS